MDNIAQQSDEMEALTSIFGDQWKIDPSTETCSIDINKEVRLYITLTPEYPSNSLPKYELLAPKLSFAQKKHVDEEFKNLYKNEGGGPLIYQMITIVEEVANGKYITDESCPEETDTSSKITEIIIPIEKPDLNIFHGSVITDRKSVFQGHVCTVNSKEDLRCFMEMLLDNKKISQATHNISAYRINLPNNVVLQDCDDDGETKASPRLLEMLQTLKLNNIIVVVSRWYGGINLGPDRFRHINNAARQALLEGGYLKN